MLKNQKLDENLLKHVKTMLGEANFPLRTDKAVISVAMMFFIERWEAAKNGTPQSLNVFNNEVERLTKRLLKLELIDVNSRGF